VTKASRVVVLIEDMRQRQLIWRYLDRTGLYARQVRFNPVRSWNGAGERRVRENYPEEVKEFRKRHAKAGTALIVVIDADTGSVQRRLSQLADSLQAGHLDAVDPKKESIAHLVPKRNIETWILCLNDTPVDEAADYKEHGDWSERIRRAAEVLVQWTRRTEPLPDHCVLSLQIGVAELKRLKL
jgi:hypothetical protein